VLSDFLDKLDEVLRRLTEWRLEVEATQSIIEQRLSEGTGYPDVSPSLSSFNQIFKDSPHWSALCGPEQAALNAFKQRFPENTPASQRIGWSLLGSLNANIQRLIQNLN
jgi:hypothetical protein